MAGFHSIFNRGPSEQLQTPLIPSIGLQIQYNNNNNKLLFDKHCQISQ